MSTIQGLSTSLGALAPAQTTATPVGSALVSSPSLTQAVEASITLDLSTLAQLIETLQIPGESSQAALVSPGTPLLPSEPQALTNTPATLASALQGSISGSGLFYESHLVSWANGQLDQASLMKELSSSSLRAPTTPSTPDATHSASNLPSSASSKAALTGAISNEVLTRIQSQLKVLDQQTVQWQGLVWPGQNAAITFAREENYERSGERSGASDEESQWRSQLELQLPHLGSVHAELVLGPQSLQIRLKAPAEKAASMRAHLPALGQQMIDAGLPSPALTINAVSDLAS